MPIAQARGAAFILNDRPDLAAETGLPTACISARKTRAYRERARAVGPDAIVGVTCHD